MTFFYYPGCSLEGTAREYDQSTRTLLAVLDQPLVDIPDWTCCGASAAAPVGRLLSLALPALNLAKVEAADSGEDILVPCSACYLNLKAAVEKTRKDPDLLAKVNVVLAEKNLGFRGWANPRHLLDVLATDIGADAVREKVTAPFTGLKVAPYYGCQCLRPYTVFDDPERPTSMEPLIEAAGATVFPWKMGARCCGASHMNTKPDVGLTLVSSILKDAEGADAIVTVCPMCQMNLEAYQKQAGKKSGAAFSVTILYLPQLLGMAMGLSEGEVGLDLNLSVLAAFREGYRASA
jgi:heterodisulfide reductase subunit B